MDTITIGKIKPSKFETTKTGTPNHIKGFVSVQRNGKWIYNVSIVDSVHKPGTIFLSSMRNGRRQFTIENVVYSQVAKLVKEQLANPATAGQPELPGTQTAGYDFSQIVPIAADISAALYGNDTQFLTQPVSNKTPKNGGAYRHVALLGFEFLTQNTKTGSSYAKLALAGNKLVWICKDHNYTGSVIYNNVLCTKASLPIGK